MSEIELTRESIVRTCNVFLARAEAVLHDARDPRKKAHEPTVEFYRGQATVCAQILSILSCFERPRPVQDILLWYVAARADGWKCETLEQDNWDHVILTRDELVVEIDLRTGFFEANFDAIFPYQV